MPKYLPNTRFSDCWGSAGDVTFYHRDGVCFWRKRSCPEFPGTVLQMEQQSVHARALEAWRNISEDDRQKWIEYAADVVTHNGVSIQLETPDNGSIMPLKVLLSKGELTFDVNVYEALISSVIESDDDRSLKNYVPLNHGSEYQSKAVYMNDRGQIIIHNDFTDGDSSPLTLIGTPAKGDIDQFQSMFIGNEKQMLTLSL